MGMVSTFSEGDGEANVRPWSGQCNASQDEAGEKLDNGQKSAYRLMFSTAEAHSLLRMPIHGN